MFKHGTVVFLVNPLPVDICVNMRELSLLIGVYY